MLFAPSGESRKLERRLVRELTSATRSIDVAMFHFTSPLLEQALIGRAQAGITVRLLLDKALANPALVDRLRAGGVDLRQVTPANESARFHHKFAVLDAKIVLTGSYNWTVMGGIANHENVVILRHAAAARTFHEGFEETWLDSSLSRP